MYLQVRLHPDDWKLQSILWREDPNQEIDHYVLTTVTFVCGPSAFLANRTLRRLAEDDGDKFPLAPPIIHNEMNGLLCVGGRLRYANISENRKHPIILPATSRLVTLLIDYMHQKMFHGGIHLIATHLRQLYWIPRLKVVLNARLRRCIVCLRYGAETAFQRMADLPAARVNQCRSFEEAGLDYAGPFPIKASRHRGNYSYKGYFAIFVCMATKAVHLEAVSSYDTKSFLAAFRRFISRRGPCRHLYSDRGTNFVGADAELRRLHSQESGFYKSICAQLRDKHNTTWHFNPPSSPHFGGLWESGVKSVKYHSKRMVGDDLFTFEEFSTLLAQIEAILNSRPLTPLSDTFEPDAVLTPAHPLIGESSVVIAEPPITGKKIELVGAMATCDSDHTSLLGTLVQRVSTLLAETK
ncbi:unnamed protein product [Trichogramma brassicae]|uniref:Integrase catalytic domain-containing protein n=1 Tax=Trichogramma brassicae TaxID=86971 RepID=A0A6H5J5A1_9HYME|nr:unnamed protein product [Trichogramma brassicae]